MLADKVKMGVNNQDKFVDWQLDIGYELFSDGIGGDAFISFPFTPPEPVSIEIIPDKEPWDVINVSPKDKTEKPNIGADVFIFKNSTYVIYNGRKYEFTGSDTGKAENATVGSSDTDITLMTSTRFNFDTELNDNIDSNTAILTPDNSYRIFVLIVSDASVSTKTNILFRINQAETNNTFNIFKVHTSHCYLTTCMVNYYGKEDDGIELTSMRKLRGFYKDKHKETLEEYRVISRYIIQGIEKTGNEDYWYGEIKKVVDKIVIWVANEEWEKAEVAYLTLYYRLKDIFYKVV